MCVCMCALCVCACVWPHTIRSKTAKQRWQLAGRYICLYACAKRNLRSPQNTLQEHVKSQNFLGACPQTPLTRPHFLYLPWAPHNPLDSPVSGCVCLGVWVRMCACLCLYMHTLCVHAITYPFLARIWQRASCGPSQVHSTLVAVKSCTLQHPIMEQHCVKHGETHPVCLHANAF